MKSFGKYISKCLATFIGLILILFFVNIVAYAWAFYGIVSNDYGDNSPSKTLDVIAEVSSVKGIPDEFIEQIKSNHIWAVYTDLNGNVIWSVDAPQEVPKRFTVQDIAVISKGYLADYPVFIRNTDDGMLILGYPQNSYTKLTGNYFSIRSIERLPYSIASILVTDFFILFLAYFFSKRKILKNTEPIINSIEALENGEPISLSLSGELSEIANSITRVSHILNKQNQARANWISGVSHDIRTPLSMIMGYAEQIAHKENADVQIRKEAEIIGQQSIKIKELVQDLNLVSQLEYEMQPLNKSPIRFASLIRSYAAELLNTGLPDHFSIDIEIAPVAETLIFDCDKRLISRAINNLVQNSIKHNPNGCDIVIALNCTVEDITLSVSDNGIGLSDEKLNDLKEKSHYMSSTDDRLDLRHGLGLVIVEKIVEAHQGYTKMQSDRGLHVTLVFKKQDTEE